jgi:hypothetical protein
MISIKLKHSIVTYIYLDLISDYERRLAQKSTTKTAFNQPSV